MLFDVESRSNRLVSGKCPVPQVVVLEVRDDSLFVASA